MMVYISFLQMLVSHYIRVLVGKQNFNTFVHINPLTTNLSIHLNDGKIYDYYYSDLLSPHVGTSWKGIRNLAVRSVSIGDNSKDQNFFTASNCQISDNAYLSQGWVRKTPFIYFLHSFGSVSPALDNIAFVFLCFLISKM